MHDQYCNNTSNSSNIKINEVALEWGYNTFWSDTIGLNERSIASVINTELTQMHGVTGP